MLPEQWLRVRTENLVQNEDKDMDESVKITMSIEFKPFYRMIWPSQSRGFAFQNDVTASALKRLH